MPNLLKDFPLNERMAVLLKQAEIKASNKKANSSIKDALVAIVKEWRNMKKT